MKPPALYVRMSGKVAIVSKEAGVIPLSQSQQQIIAELAVHEREFAGWQDIAAAIWGSEMPSSARASLQNQISRIRALSEAEIIETSAEGYRLVPATDIEIIHDTTVKTLVSVREAEQELALNSSKLRRVAETGFKKLDRLLRETSDEILAGIETGPTIQTYRNRARLILETARSARLEVAVFAGRWAWALIEGEKLVSEDQLDERIAANYARALALAGKRGDALSHLSKMRRLLRLDLGVAPGPELHAAESEILLGKLAGSLAATGRDQEQSTLEVPFLGRDNELRKILEAVANKHTVFVKGDYGSGLSRMLQEVTVRLNALNVRTFYVRAEEHPQSAMSLLDELLNDMGVTKDPTQNALSAFSLEVQKINPSNPTVFVIDDAEYLGPTSWQALQVLMQAEHGGLIIGSHKDLASADRGLQVTLAPLDDETSLRLLHHLGIEDKKLVREIAASASGNPLAIELLVRDHFNRMTEEGEERVPDSLFARFLERIIGELSPAEKQNLEMSAIAGDGYPVAALDTVNWGQKYEIPGRFVETNTLGQLRFKYGGLQQYVYDAIAEPTLLERHYVLGIAARDINAPRSNIAWHLLAAAALDPEAAVEAAEAAALESTRLGAHADAAGWFKKAKRATSTYMSKALTGEELIGKTLSLEIEQANALRLAGDPNHLQMLIDTTRSALAFGDEKLIAKAGFALLQLGGSSTAGELNPKLESLTKEVLNAITDPELKATVQAAASLSWSMTGNAKKARAYFDQAEKTGTSIESRLNVLPFTYLALGLPADLQRRETLGKELLSLAKTADIPEARWEGLHIIFTVALQKGDGKKMRTTLREMEAMIHQIGDVGRRWSTQYCAATVAQIDGDTAKSEALTTRAYETFKSVSPERAAAAYYGQLLAIHMAAEDLKDLKPVVFELVQKQPGVTAWHAAAALIHATENSPQEARTHAEHALNFAQNDFTWLAAHMVAGKAVAKIRDLELVQEFTEKLLPWQDLVCWQGTCSYGPVAGVLAELAAARGDTAESERFTAKKEAILERLAS